MDSFPFCSLYPLKQATFTKPDFMQYSPSVSLFSCVGRRRGTCTFMEILNTVPNNYSLIQKKNHEYVISPSYTYYTYYVNQSFYESECRLHLPHSLTVTTNHKPNALRHFKDEEFVGTPNINSLHNQFSQSFCGCSTGT